MEATELPKLVRKLSHSDVDFCTKIVEHSDKLWIHFYPNSAVMSETEEYGPETLLVTSVENVKISGLNRTEKTINLAEPIQYMGMIYETVDISRLNKFKNHMNSQANLAREHFNWDVLDTGVTKEEALNMLGR
jgi:hypothetical protein